MRDSIGSLYIHGKEPNTDMITEEAYAPYFCSEFRCLRMRQKGHGSYGMILCQDLYKLCYY
jgi:hypothetical protein